MNHKHPKMICAAIPTVVCACLFWFFSWGADASATVDDPGSFTLELASSKPLPYQAVRIRYVLRNNSENRIGPNPWVDDSGFPEVKVTGGSQAKWLGIAVLLVDVRDGIAATARENKNARARMFLAPGEVVSASQAAAADWRPPGPRQPPKAIFAKPGTYSFVLPWANPVELECLVPRGDDQGVFRQLNEDPFLARAIMSPVQVPDPDAVDALYTLVREHPKSSYADYARFALARAHLKGIRIERTSKEKWEGIISTLIQELRGNSREEKVADFISFVFHNRRPRGKLAALVSDLVDAKDGPADKRGALISRVADLLYVSGEDRSNAISLLDQIKSRDFAYRPNALILLRKAVADDRERAGQISDELNRDFPDSIEWLEEIAKDIPQSEWLEYRIKHSVDRSQGAAEPPGDVRRH